MARLLSEECGGESVTENFLLKSSSNRRFFTSLLEDGVAVPSELKVEKVQILKKSLKLMNAGDDTQCYKIRAKKEKFRLNFQHKLRTFLDFYSSVECKYDAKKEIKLKFRIIITKYSKYFLGFFW